MPSYQKSKIILNVSKSKKHTYGLCLIDSKKYFFKEDALKEEGNNLFLRNNAYQTPTIAFKEDNIIYYFYDEDLYCNTLYDCLYFNGSYFDELDNWFAHLEKRIFECKIKKKINQTCSYHFFNERFDQLDLALKVNHSFEPAIINIKNLLTRNIHLRSYISNGDLTDTNICLNGKICDVENAGFNLVSSDLAIFFVSILYGSWIYPRYHQEAYTFRINRLKNPKPSLNERQKLVLEKILNIVKKLDQVEQEYFKCFVLFRLLSPITYDQLNSLDQDLILKLFKKIEMSFDMDTLLREGEHFYQELNKISL